ncbi:MAG: His-Xaa-Ser system radical SAM maturase HxsB [Candidatus Diapherotrites archaeon]|nr:His-Xaa-Ser system radical SAM maturase HxsB [Candidatus Diapherotrites archaeon]
MAQSFYATEYVASTPYAVNSYNSFKFDEDHILVTTEHSAWSVLSEKEFELLRLGKVQEDQGLFKELEEKGIILTEKNAQQVVKDYKLKKNFLFSNPSLHIITPTMRCNQRCLYCHSVAKQPNAKDVDLDWATGKAIVDFILKFPLKSFTIEFQGGDCLMNFDVAKKIMGYARSKSKKAGKKVNFALVSNLTLMNDTVLSSLAKYNVKGIATSLDGPKAIHDKNRPFLGGAGSYDKAVYWIDRIRGEWKHSFNLNALCTITKNSLGHEKEIVDEYLKHGLVFLWVRPLNNLGFAKEEWEKIGYTPEEFLASWKKFLDYIIEKNREGEKIMELFTVLFLKKIITKREPQMVDVMSPCGAAIGQLLYNYKGDIFTCDDAKVLPEFRLGNVKTSTARDIFLNPTTISLVDISSKKNFLCDRCPWEPYCGICPVYSYSAEGTIVSKLAMNDRCKVYGSMIEHIFRKILFSPEDRRILFGWIEGQKVFS